MSWEIPRTSRGYFVSMRTQALNVIYDSEICPPTLKEQIVPGKGSTLLPT